MQFLVANISKNLYFILNRLFNRTEEETYFIRSFVNVYMIKVNCKKSISVYAIASISSNFLRSESDIDLTSVSSIRYHTFIEKGNNAQIYR